MAGAPGLEVRGLDVHQTVTEPAVAGVTHGRFAVRNSGAEPRRVAVTSVAVTVGTVGMAGTAAVPVTGFYVYRLPDYDEVPATAVDVAAGAEVSFEVSFAAVRPQPVEPAGPVAVAVEVTVAGHTTRVLSPWSSTIRTPRR